jgi:hypothetical protein
MRMKDFMRRLELAHARVQKEIFGNAQGGKYAAGISSEGYAGGYQQCLMDVQAVLTHGYPSDPRGYWKNHG